jgi:hypothetical protein
VADLFDLHIHASLEYYWRQVYGPNFEDFKRLYARLFEFNPDTGEHEIDEPLVSSWHDALLGVTDDHPTPNLEHLGIGVAYSSGIERLPWIGLELRDAPPSEGFLGNLVDIRDGFEYEGGMADQQVTIHLFGSPQMVRALHVLVRAIMYRATRRFLRVGYQNVVYEGADDVNPDEKLIEEYGGIMQRAMRWRALGVVQVPIGEIGHKEVRVHAVDTFIDGNPGGAAPWLEEE